MISISRLYCIGITFLLDSVKIYWCLLAIFIIRVLCLIRRSSKEAVIFAVFTIVVIYQICPASENGGIFLGSGGIF